MSDRNSYIFSDFVSINPLVTLKGNTEYSFIEMKDLSDGQRFAYPSIERKLTGGARFEESDTLFARITPCLENGKICQAKGLRDGKGFGSTEFLVFRGKEGISNNDFVFYLSRWDEVRKYAEANLVGTSGRQRVPKDVFYKLELELPDFETQTRIASILSSLDEKIELNRRISQTLEQMAQAYFYEYCLQGELVRLEQLVEFNPKLSFKKGQVGTYVEMADLPERGLSINNSLLREFNGGSKFQNGDTLFARITPCLENGKTGFVDILNKNEIGFGSTEFIVMRAKENVSQYFPYMIARDSGFREHATKSMVGTSGRQRVQTEMLLSLKVPRCSEEQINSFHEFAEPIFLKIKAITKEIKTLTGLRDTLLPKLMSGEIDIDELINEELIVEECDATEVA